MSDVITDSANTFASLTRFDNAPELVDDTIICITSVPFTSLINNFSI